jgi:outer membrane protein assembly factor BamB
MRHQFTCLVLSRMRAAAFAVFLAIMFMASSASAMQAHTIAQLPKGTLSSGFVVMASEVVPGGIRAFSPEGELRLIYDHPDWTTSGAGRPLALAPDGHFWVCDINMHSAPGDGLSGKLYEFTSNLQFLRSFSVNLLAADPFGVGLRGLAFGPEGTIYAVGGWQSGQVNLLLEIEPERCETLHAYNLPFEPVGICMGKDGYLYLDGYYGGLHKVDRKTGIVVQSFSCPMGGTNLGELKCLSSGRVLATNNSPFGTGQFLLFDGSLGSSNACPTPIPFVGPGPYGLDLFAGRIYAGSTDNRIHILDACTGQQLSQIVVTQHGLSGAISSLVVVP